MAAIAFSRTIAFLLLCYSIYRAQMWLLTCTEML